jgi:hypothetical protein
MTTIVVPALSRDPYAAAFVWGICGSRLCRLQGPVVMGPCVRRDDEIESSRYQRI